MNIALYARVSDPKLQDSDDKVSIDQQLADMRELCARNGWHIVAEFVDREYYRATQSPKKGKVVNPSGERADRPQFLAMLKVVKAGEADAVLCWRDDRLVRHPRVAVVLEDALDIGDVQRNGRPKIEVRDATGAVIDRFTLSIKATIWREENKRRAERVRMGKVATLEQGYWPGAYQRLGYKTRKGPRGRIIETEEREAEIVREIHRMYDAGVTLTDIRLRLVHNDREQKGTQKRRHDWHPTLICTILRAEDYTGIATWNFGDGTTRSIDIPAIIDRDLWQRNQARMGRNQELSTRNAKGIYLLQRLVYCGHCGASMSVSCMRWIYRNGQRYPRKDPVHVYRCNSPHYYPDEPHPRPCDRYGPTLDWEVWRQLVDNGIKRPDLIRSYVLGCQARLQAQGESVDGDIAQARQKLAEVDQARLRLHRQIARGRMDEKEYDILIDETEDNRNYWESELARLQELRDNQDSIEAGLDYVTELMTALQARLPEIDLPPKELRALPKEQQTAILKERQIYVRALVDRVEVWANGDVKIEGVLDGSEGAQFRLGDSRSG